MTNDIIISQLREIFKGMIGEVLREERREYLEVIQRVKRLPEGERIFTK